MRKARREESLAWNHQDDYRMIDQYNAHEDDQDNEEGHAIFFTQNDQDDDHDHDCHLLCCQLFPRRLQVILNLPDIRAQARFLRFHVLKLSLQLQERVSLKVKYHTFLSWTCLMVMMMIKVLILKHF